MSDKEEIEEEEEEQGGEEKIPMKIHLLFEDFRKNKLRSADRGELAQFIVDKLNRDPGWDYLAFVEEKYKYNDEEKKRFERFVKDIINKDFTLNVKQAAKLAAARAERKEFTEFVEEEWKQLHSLAKSTLIKIYEKAKEEGYYDEGAGVVKADVFVNDAIEFFLENKDRIADLEEENEHLGALLESLVEVFGANYALIHLTELYVWFIAKVQELQAYGYQVPEEIVESVTQLLDQTYENIRQTFKEKRTIEEVIAR